MVTLGVVTLGSGLSDSQPSRNSKYQDLPKFQFSGRGLGVGGVGGWYSQPSQNSKWQDLPKFQLGGGGGTLNQVKTQSAKICLNFNFRVGGQGVLYCSESGALSEF